MKSRFLQTLKCVPSQFLVALNFIAVPVAIICTADVQEANAALTVSISSADVQVGGKGSVFIELTGANDPIQSFQVEVKVSPVGSVGSSLQLIDPSPDDIYTDTNFIFFNDSFSEDFAIDPSVVSSVDSPSDTLSLIDSTSGGTNVLVSTPKRLGRIDFQHRFPAASDPSSLVGDQFTFEIVNTSFADQNFANVPFSVNPVAGMVTISAVPEPSVSLLCLAISTLAMTRRFKRRRELSHQS